MENRNEILDGIVGLLRQHKEGLRGTIHQEPYKGDFFRFFAAAWNAGLIDQPQPPGYLSADALADAPADCAPDVVDIERWDTTWFALLTMWGEWTYAWRRRDQI